MANLPKGETWRGAMVVASVGIEMAVSILVGWFVGDRLDLWLGTTPYLMYSFFALGVAAGFMGLWRTARKNWPKDDE